MSILDQPGRYYVAPANTEPPPMTATAGDDWVQDTWPFPWEAVNLARPGVELADPVRVYECRDEDDSGLMGEPIRRIVTRRQVRLQLPRPLTAPGVAPPTLVEACARTEFALGWQAAGEGHTPARATFHRLAFVGEQRMVCDMRFNLADPTLGLFTLYVPDMTRGAREEAR